MSTQSIRMKYVRHNIAGFILWPDATELYHAHVGAEAIRRCGGHVISAGFVQLRYDMVICGGKSESLGIASLPEDTRVLSEQLGIKPLVL